MKRCAILAVAAWAFVVIPTSRALADGLDSKSATPSPKPATAPSPLTDDDRETLLRYARGTWRAFERLSESSLLPADGLHQTADGAWEPSDTTSPTDIACYLWSILAAEKLALIPPEQASRRLDESLKALAKLELGHGFFFNQYHARTGIRLGSRGKEPGRPFLSTVDNGWLAAALIVVGNARPALHDRAEALLKPMDFGFFYVPFDAADPKAHPGQLHGGIYTDDQSLTTFYGMVNTEPRIASYIAISRGQVPPEHFYRLFRTLPESMIKAKRPIEGTRRTYLGVEVFEGHVTVRDRNVVPSWGGSMFEALMVTLLVPEAQWSPRSWGVNHPEYVQIQIEHGLQVRQYGVWGFSPSCKPEGGYQTYGVDALGANPEGYLSHNSDPRGVPSTTIPVAGHLPDGVVTPHASFLALAFAPREAMANLRVLEQRFPIHCDYGFRDSVNCTSGQVSDCILALDQGMILAAIANTLADNLLQRHFTAGPVETILRPLIAPEEFTAGPAGPKNPH